MIAIGPFTLLDPIAEGGMGAVWRGIHEPSGTPVAIKILTGRTTQRPRFRQTFRNEARAMSGLRHRNIAQIFDYGEVNPDSSAGQHFGRRCPYLVMEYVDSNVGEVDAVSDWPALKRLLFELLEALAHAHARGVIHRDLKPNNLLIKKDGQLKLSDFGIAFTTDHAGVDVERLRAAGTPEYMAPEQCHGMWRDFGPWTDLYGVGCVAYTILTGHPPFNEGHPMGTMLAKLEREPPTPEAKFEVPSELGQWVSRLLRRTPRRRFQRAADALWSLKAFAGTSATIVSVDAMPTSSEEQFVSDTLIGVGIDDMNRLTSSNSYDVEPNFDGSSTGIFRMNRAPIPVEWRGQERHDVPQLIDTGLELAKLRMPKIVGREGVRDRLWKTLRFVHTQGEQRAVLLKGPAGVGKSRLVQWVCERAHEEGIATILHAHHAADAGPVHGLAPMLMRHLRCAGLPRSDVRKRLFALLGEFDSEPLETVDALTEFVLPTAEEATQDATVTVKFFSLVERHILLADYLERLAIERTVILWLDDVHWGYESLDFIQWLMKRKRGAFLILMTASQALLNERPVEMMTVEDLVRDETTDVIDLPPLPGDAHAALIKNLLFLDPGLALRVEERTAGNPLFAIHLIQDWIAGERLLPSPTGYVLVEGTSSELPIDLATVWSQRVDQLFAGFKAEDVIAIELAATLGQEVNQDEWRNLCRLSGIEPSADLVSNLIRTGFITVLDEKSAELGWTFAHAMLRETVERYADHAGRRQGHHTLCVGWLRTRDRFDPRIPYHLCAAGQYEAALAPFERLTNMHMLATDYRATAATLFDWRNALNILDEPPTSVRYRQTELIEYIVLAMRGQFDLADVGLATLIDRLNAEIHEALICRALMQRGRIAIDQGRFRDAMGHLDACAAQTTREDTLDTWAWCHWYLGVAHGSTGSYAGAIKAFNEAESAFLAMDDMVHASLCLLGLTRIAQHQGQPDEAARLIEAAHQELSRAGARLGVAAAVHARAELFRLQGELKDAEKLYRQAQELYTATGSAKGIRVELDIASIKLTQEAYLEAQLILEKVLRTAVAQGRRVLATQAQFGLLICAAQRRDWYEWDRHLAGASKGLEATGVVSLDIATNCTKAAQIAEAASHLRRAQACYEAAIIQWHKMNRRKEKQSTQARLSGILAALN